MGKPRSEEHRRKLSEALRGKKHSPETKAKMSKAHKGKTHSPEAKAKISKAQMGNTHAKGHFPSQETLAKMSEAVSRSNRERPLTPETRAKRSFNAAKLMAEGRIGPKLGKCLEYTTKEGEIITLRSSWEIKVATFLDQSGWIWAYEQAPITHNGESWLPDFFVYNTQGKLVKIIEVKGWLRPKIGERLVRLRDYLASQGIELEIWNQEKLEQLGIL